MSSTVPVRRFEPGSPSPSAMPSGRRASVTRPSFEAFVVTLLARISWPSIDSRPVERVDHPGVDEVERADERRHERGRREVVDLRGRADLLDPALAHDHDPVGQRERLLLVVGDVDRGDPELALDRPDLLAQDDPDLGVERRQRLVEEQDLRLDGERAGERDALLLAARQLPRVAVAAALRGGSARAAPSTRLSMSAFGRLRTLSPKPMLSATVMFGKRAYDWKTIPTLRWFGGLVGDVLAVDGDRAGGRLLEARRSSAASSSCRSPTARGTTRTRRGRHRG